jgi:hypothetical protein
MSYTNLVLFGLGALGILLHNLVELNKINKASNGNSIKIKKYLKLETFSIIISAIIVVCAIVIKNEIKQLEQASKWLGLSFITIGYMGQSLLVFIMGRANKVIGKNEEGKDA